MSHQTKLKPKLNKPSYHHGDLRSTLLSTADSLLKETDIEGLSLRKLADKVGVSRTASYHYFKGKNQLLCAIAEQGFVRWQQDAVFIFNQVGLTPKDKYH